MNVTGGMKFQLRCGRRPSYQRIISAPKPIGNSAWLGNPVSQQAPGARHAHACSLATEAPHLRDIRSADATERQRQRIHHLSHITHITTAR